MISPAAMSPRRPVLWCIALWLSCWMPGGGLASVGLALGVEISGAEPEVARTFRPEATALRIDPPIADADWVSMGEQLGTNGLVRCVQFRAGMLYVAGDFTVVQGTMANRIARWDGSAWSALGSGTDGSVSALAFSPAGDLYAAGSFTTAGGATASRIAKWDGTNWSALGTGVNGSVSSLATDSAGNLYAAGGFSTAGGKAARYAAKWDGEDWYAVGTGVPSNSISALACDATGKLYAGGDFTSIGGIDADRIAVWDGSVWAPLGTGRNSGVRALAFSAAGDLYAGGLFSYGVAKWDGTSWAKLGTGVTGGVSALVFDASGNLYLGGSFTAAGTDPISRVAKWDGVSVSAVGTGMDNSVATLACDASGNLVAGGSFSTAGGHSARYLACWRDGDWSAYGSGLDGDVTALLCDDAGHLYAGGEFTTVPGGLANHVAQWDGAQWSTLGDGVNGKVAALVRDASGNLYVGGDFTTAGGTTVNYVAKWDGSDWSPLGTGMNGAVATLCIDSSGHLLAGGLFTTANSVEANRIARWDGSDWSPLGTGMNGGVESLACAGDGSVYAAGGFTTAGEVTARYVAKWDGATWSALGAGATSVAYALALDGSGNLYLGGNFLSIGGLSVSRVAKWDGAAWSALANGMAYDVRVLLCDASGNLYVGGDFTATSGVTVNRLAKWNGTQWSALGTGLSKSVFALALDPAGDLYVGGEFATAGGQISPYLAKCRMPDAPEAVADAYAAAPNTALEVAAPGVLANDSDADGDDLTAIKASEPSHGTVTLAGDGSFSYVPAADYVGIDSFTYRANDGRDDSAETTVTITVGNRAPEATDDSYVIWRNSPRTVNAPGVLANDTDADGNTLSAVLVSDPAHGTLILDGTGAFTYTPDGGFLGADSFTYRANDGVEDSHVATVTVSVVQTYPVTFDLGEHGTRTGGGDLIQTVAHGDPAAAPEFTTEAGWTFTGWDVPFAVVTSVLTVTAQYEVTTYVLTVENGTGGGAYVAGSVVPVSADLPVLGKEFSGWTVAPTDYTGNLADASASSTVFTMPDEAVTLTATYVYTAPEWTVELTLAGAAPTTLTFGMRNDATAGWDAGIDVQYPLPATGQACLAADDLALSYSTEYRAPAETSEFLLIACAPDDGTITVSWDVSGLPEGKYLSIYEVTLADLAPSRAPVARTLVGNTALNLALAPSLEIPAGELRCFVLRYGDDLVFDLAIGAGWNLISLPIEPTDPAVECVLADGALRDEGGKLRDGLRGTISSRDVCTWQGQSYAVVTELHACVGYWVHAVASTVLLVTGTPADQTAITLVRGWNQCGVETPRPMPGDDRVIGTPWAWNPQLMRYQAGTLLRPGWGYWINASEGFTIPLGTR